MMTPPARLIYLACPYSANDPEITRQRVRTFCKIASHLIRSGATMITRFHFVSPVLNDLLVQADEKLPTSFGFWSDYSFTLLERCNELWVITMDGWEESPGVQAEIEAAKHLRRHIYFVDPVTAEVKWSGIGEKPFVVVAEDSANGERPEDFDQHDSTSMPKIDS